MIIYDSNNLCFIWRLEGSVVPKSFWFSLPALGQTVFWYYFLEEQDVSITTFELALSSASLVWAAVTFVLGILLSARTNSSYNRFWEGITLVQQMRAEWFESTSNLVAFSAIAVKVNPSSSRVIDKVNDFHHVLVRLMSLMHGTALRQIGGNEENFEVLDINSLDRESITFLHECEDSDVNRVEVLLHWIQVLVTECAAEGVLAVPAPILTRAYQTLSRGMVNLHNARKLADVPFPFPFSQMIVILLIFHNLFTPYFATTMVKSLGSALVVCFLPIFGMWSITFIASELEQPFGSDANDLPLSVLQYEFNTSLLMLLDKESMRAPHLQVAAGKKTVQHLRDHFGEGTTSKSNTFISVEKKKSQRSQRSSTQEENDDGPSRHSMDAGLHGHRASGSIASSAFNSMASVAKAASTGRTRTSVFHAVAGMFNPGTMPRSHEETLRRKRRKSRSFDDKLTTNRSFLQETTSFGAISDFEIDLGSISEVSKEETLKSKPIQQSHSHQSCSWESGLGAGGEKRGSEKISQTQHQERHPGYEKTFGYERSFGGERSHERSENKFTTHRTSAEWPTMRVLSKSSSVAESSLHEQLEELCVSLSQVAQSQTDMVQALTRRWPLDLEKRLPALPAGLPSPSNGHSLSSIMRDSTTAAAQNDIPTTPLQKLATTPVSVRREWGLKSPKPSPRPRTPSPMATPRDSARY